MQRYVNAIIFLICPCTDSNLCMNNAEAVRSIETDMCMSDLSSVEGNGYFYIYYKNQKELFSSCGMLLSAEHGPQLCTLLPE